MFSGLNMRLDAITPLTRSLMLALAFGATLACSSNSDNEVGGTAGNYTLSRINGFPPPLTVAPGDGHTYVVQSGSVTLDANNTYSGSIDGTRDGVAFEFFRDAGGWTQSGSTITFDSVDPAVPNYSGQLSGSTLTSSQVIQGFAVSLTFRRN